MSKVRILRKTGRSEATTLANQLPLMDNKIYYKMLPNGTYSVIAKWGFSEYLKDGHLPESTEIIITSISATAKALIKESLGLRNKVYWVEIQ